MHTDSGGWYFCENEDLPSPAQRSPQEALLPPHETRSGLISDPEIISLSSLLTRGKRDQLEPDPPASLSDQQSEGGHGNQSGRLREAIERMIESQIEVSAKRLKVRELRQGLRYKREEEGALRATVVKRLNILFAQNVDGAPLLPEFEQLQSATDAYLAMERSYNQAEDELEQEEYALSKTMGRLSDFLRETSATAALDTREFSEYNADDASSTISGLDELPPCVAEYLSRVGDLRIMQERLSELESEWLSIAENQILRQRVGAPMAEESLQFLRRYDEQRMQTQNEINHAFLAIKQVRAVCDSEGVAVDQYPKGLDTIHSLQLGEIAQPPRDPLKTSAVSDSHPFFEPEMPTQLNRTTFINKWILHQLSHSSVEIERLKSLPELQSLEEEGFDDVSISRLALTMWFADDAGAFPPPSSPQGSYGEPKESGYGDDGPGRHHYDRAWERAAHPMPSRSTSERQLGRSSTRRLRSLSFRSLARSV